MCGGWGGGGGACHAAAAGAQGICSAAYTQSYVCVCGRANALYVCPLVPMHVLAAQPLAAAPLLVSTPAGVPAVDNLLSAVAAPPGTTASVVGWRLADSSTLIPPGSGAVPLVNPITGAVTGSMEVVANGTYSFTPAPGYTGAVPPVVAIAASGGQLCEVPLTLSVNVPVRVAGTSLSVLPDAPALIDVLSGVVTTPGVSVAITSFTLLDGSTHPAGPNPVTVQSTLSNSAVATVIVRTNGSIVYMPLPGISGQLPPLTYTVASSDGQAVPGVLGVTVESGRRGGAPLPPSVG